MGPMPSSILGFFTVLPTLGTSSSTLDTRLLVSVRNCDRTTVDCRTRILEVLAWSFECLRSWVPKVYF